MKYQAKKLTGATFSLLLASGLAGCGVASEVASSRPAMPVEAMRAAPVGAPLARRSVPGATDRAPLPAATTTPAERPTARVSEAAAPAPETSAAPTLARAPNMRTQSGRIIDEAGQPLVGATVILQGTTHGASTDATGGYSLDVPLGLNTFVFGYGGYQDEVAQSRDGQPITVTLLPVAGHASASQEPASRPRPAKARRQ
jgi:hypothetical protein